jgi:hypothetical protein
MSEAGIESGARPSEPTGIAGPAGGPTEPAVECGCGFARNKSGAPKCARCGRFLRGNPLSRKHGLWAYRRNRTLPADLRVSVEEFREALISAQGGLASLDDEPVRAGLVRLLVDCETGKRLLMNEVVKRGIETKPGRDAYAMLLSTMDRWLQVATKLGLERRSRSVASPLAYMRGEAELNG